MASAKIKTRSSKNSGLSKELDELKLELARSKSEEDMLRSELFKLKDDKCKCEKKENSNRLREQVQKMKKLYNLIMKENEEKEILIEEMEKEKNNNVNNLKNFLVGSNWAIDHLMREIDRSDNEVKYLTSEEQGKRTVFVNRVIEMKMLLLNQKKLEQSFCDGIQKFETMMIEAENVLTRIKVENHEEMKFSQGQFYILKNEVASLEMCVSEKLLMNIPVGEETYTDLRRFQDHVMTMKGEITKREANLEAMNNEANVLKNIAANQRGNNGGIVLCSALFTLLFVAGLLFASTECID